MSWTRRITVNLTAEADEALARLPGRDRTAALNRALRLADLVERWTVNGRLTVIRDDGTTVEIYVL